MDQHFPRPEYAAELTQQLLGQSMFATDTLVLGAPRRTGKSTFLQEDLTPALEAKGALVLYVDLWKNQDADPVELISFTIANALAQQQGKIAKVAKAAGLTKVSIHGVEFSLDAVGKVPGASVADALEELQKRAGVPVVFIIDEAQHVIKSEGGMTLMFGLKSARDTINRPGARNLILVMSGSDRDKLLRLVHGNATPFFGSEITTLPLLDRTFTDFYAGLLAVEKPDLRPDNDRFYKAFVKFHHRPEPFLKKFNTLTGILGPKTTNDLHDQLDKLADEYEEEQFALYETAYLGLTKLQRAVLTRVLSHGRTGKLFDAKALEEYTKAQGKQVLAGAARNAIERLREIDPPLIWKSARGDYAPVDSGMRAWYELLVKNGQWPPQD